jgi:hypothetical protein
VLTLSGLRLRLQAMDLKPRGFPLGRSSSQRVRLKKSARAPQTFGGSVRPSKETPSGPSKHADTKDRGHT